MTEFLADVMTEPDAISALIARAMAFLGEAGVDARATHHVALVLDELLTNVGNHGAASEAPASVRLTVGLDRIGAEISDGGAEFDPRCMRDLDLTASVEDRPIGGLGLILVQRLTEVLDYERVGERNNTTFWIRRTPVA
jgi:serine/threonine-protein kinase RsbW